jgi:iron(III) transport system ATP-binding protein
MTDPLIRARGLVKRFGSVTALEGFDLDVPRGVILALLGPSGCGKTTALRVLAGLEAPDAGEVDVGGRRMTGGGTFVPPERRRIGMVFQDWALFPHLDVAHNVAFGVEGRDQDRVWELLSMMGLGGMERRMPHELSGGQQQRVAVARALAPRPEAVLLDEPFSNLDAGLRARLRREVRDILRLAGVTTVFVTHDQEEALSIADRIAVMADGRVLQAGEPLEVYEQPATPAVAALLGDANFLPGEVRGGVVSTAIGELPAAGQPPGAVEVMLRPEALRVEPEPDGAVVEDVEFFGHDQLVRVRLRDGTSVRVRPIGPRPELRAGAAVRVEAAGTPTFFRTEVVAGERNLT